jgi:molecular chaperone GrpE
MNETASRNDHGPGTGGEPSAAQPRDGEGAQREQLGGTARPEQPANAANSTGDSDPQAMARSLRSQVASLQGQVASLQGQVASLQGRLAEQQDLRLRAVADLDNLRKRCAKEVGGAEAAARARVAIQWLPVVDNLERALEHAQADPRTIIVGLRAVLDQALGVLSQLGFPRRDDAGVMFDPARHEAVAARTQPDVPAGAVIEVVRPGYGDGEHQLRPAQVVVAKPD